MGSNPINLAVRFLLEISGLAILGWWGWSLSKGIFQFVLALGIPILAATLWGLFAVPDDPSRSGSAPVQVPGIVRFLLELAFFGSAIWALVSTGLPGFALLFGLIVIILGFISNYDPGRFNTFRRRFIQIVASVKGSEDRCRTIRQNPGFVNNFNKEKYHA